MQASLAMSIMGSSIDQFTLGPTSTHLRFWHYLPYKRINGKRRVARTHRRHVRWIHTGGTFKHSPKTIAAHEHN